MSVGTNVSLMLQSIHLAVNAQTLYQFLFDWNGNL